MWLGIRSSASARLRTFGAWLRIMAMCLKIVGRWLRICVHGLAFEDV